MKTHPYTWLKREMGEALRIAGFNECREHLHPDVFGSAYTSYANERWELRIVWDGKEGWAVLERRPAGRNVEWSDAAELLTEGDLEREPIDEGKIQQWRDAIAACGA